MRKALVFAARYGIFVLTGVLGVECGYLLSNSWQAWAIVLASAVLVFAHDWAERQP